MALIDGLVSYWKLDEASGNATDSVGSNTLTNVNSSVRATGKINNGADLESGSAQYFSIADASQSGLDFGTGDFTFNIWIKPESIGTNGDGFFSKGSGGGNSQYWMRFNNNTGNVLRFLTTQGSSESSVSTSAAGISVGNWYMLTFKRSGTTLSIKVNAGTAVTATGTVRNCDNASAFLLGAGPGNQPFDGILDEVGVWNRATTDEEDTQLYNAGAGLSYPFTKGSSNFFQLF